MNNALLHSVARVNVDRIYGDHRFDWIDDDFVEAVVAVGATLRVPERERRTVQAPAAQNRGESARKINALLLQLQEGRAE